MADESVLDGLDPFDLLEEEAARVHRLFLSDPDWARPSRCDGWDTRAMLGHLTALEDYVAAGLDGTVRALIRRGASEGALDVSAFNDWGVRNYEAVPTGELVDGWWKACRRNAAALRARGREGVVDSSIGDYPSWLQTFHFAVEYATHGDDIGVAVEHPGARTHWRAVFGRFVLDELEKPVQVEVLDDTARARSADGEIALTLTDFVEATQGRLSADHPLAEGWRRLLAAVP